MWRYCILSIYIYIFNFGWWNDIIERCRIIYLYIHTTWGNLQSTLRLVSEISFGKETRVSELKVSEPSGKLSSLVNPLDACIYGPRWLIGMENVYTLPRNLPGGLPKRKIIFQMLCYFQGGYICRWILPVLWILWVSLKHLFGGDTHELLPSRQLLAPRLGYSRFRQRCSACMIGKVGWGLVCIQ